MATLPPPPAESYAPARQVPHPYPGSDYRPFGRLPTAVAMLLGLMALLSLVVVYLSVDRARVVEGYFLDGDLTRDEFEDADARLLAARLVYFAGSIGTGVVFIVWQYRHAKNAVALAGHPAGLGPGWAIGGWFIPCASYVLPCIQMFGASKASDPGLPARPAAGWGRGSGLVVLWAALFGVATMTAFIADAQFPDDDLVFPGEAQQYVDDARAADYGLAVGAVVMAAAAVAAAVMVRSLTGRQVARARAVESGGATPNYGGVSFGGPPPAWGPPQPAPAPPQASGAPPGPGATSAPGAGPGSAGGWLPPGQPTDDRR